MKSRLSKYENNDNLSRVERNQNLYDDMYSNTNYTNMVVIDDSNEIDISKIKEIVDSEKNKTRRTSKNNFNKEEYDRLVPVKSQEEKSYDINKVLEEELSKTRKVYENLIKEEKELLNLMNTMTNMTSDDIANDMFQDLTRDDNFTEILDVEEKPDVNIKQIDNDTTEYSTDTFMFNTKDFEGIEDLKNNLKKTSTFVKVLIAILLIAIVAAGVIVYLKLK